MVPDPGPPPDFRFFLRRFPVVIAPQYDWRVDCPCHGFAISVALILLIVHVDRPVFGSFPLLLLLQHSSLLGGHCRQRCRVARHREHQGHADQGVWSPTGEVFKYTHPYRAVE